MSANDKFIFKQKHLFWIIASILFVYVFAKINSILMPFYISFAVVVFFNFIVNRLEKYKIPRAVSAGIIVIAVYSFCIYLIVSAGQFAFFKATNSVSKINNYKEYFVNIEPYISELIKKFDVDANLNFLTKKLSMLITEHSEVILKQIAKGGTSLISVIALLALTPIVSFLMLKDMPKIKRTFYNLLPQNIKKETRTLINEMHNSVFKFIEGQTVAAIALSIMYSVMLYFIGLNHFVSLGVIIGFSSFVPYIGFYSATFATLLSAHSQFHDMRTTLTTLVALLVGQIIDSGFITPKIVGNKLGVHPLFVIFGVLMSVPLFGFIGVLLALPIIGVCGVLARFFVKKYKASSYYKK